MALQELDFAYIPQKWKLNYSKTSEVNTIAKKNVALISTKVLSNISS